VVSVIQGGANLEQWLVRTSACAQRSALIPNTRSIVAPSGYAIWLKQKLRCSDSQASVDVVRTLLSKPSSPHLSRLSDFRDNCVKPC